jgi:hypothetical protein
MRPHDSSLAFHAWAVILLVVSTSCSRGSDTSGVIVRDTAGVTIVESHEGVWSEGEGW